MAVQAHQIQEIDCKIDALDDQTVAAFLDDSVKDDPEILSRIAPIAARCCETLHPRGVYKVFNPAIIFAALSWKRFARVKSLRGTAAC